MRRAFLVFIASAVTAALSLQLPSGSDNRAASTALAAPLLQWLHVEGNRIVNEAGKTVILRGVNLENREWVWNSGPSINFERQAIPVAAGSPSSGGWGANIILLAVASGPVNRNNATYLSHLDELVALSKSYGAYTLLVYSYGEPNSEQATMPDQAAQNAMARLAGRYASEPSVLYGLQVEPHDVSWSSLKPRFTSMVDAIRAKNPRALIAVPGTQWGRYVHWALNDPIPRSNLVYKSHYYDPFSAFDSSYKLSQVAAKYPVILGEFGVGSSSSLSDVRSLLDTAERLGISWVGWLFHKVACPCMLNSTTDWSPNSYGQEVRNRLRGAYNAPASTPPGSDQRAPASIHWVYGDTLQWQDWSWNTTVNPNATSAVFAGSATMAVTYNAPWAGLSLYNPGLNTSPYTHLRFAIRPGGVPLSAVSVSLYNTSGGLIRRVDPQGYATSTGNGWQLVAIPLTDLGAAKTTITRIQLQENTGRNQPTFYLDNIGFERRVGATSGVSISEGDTWRYFKGRSQPPSSWTSTRFDDSTWAQGRSGFGFGDGDDATVLNDMSGNYTSLYLRKTFDVSDPKAITSLVMTMDFDDGFVAYLNGTVVVRRNVPGSPPAYNATAVEHHHEASGGNDAPQPVEQYDLSDFGLHLLVPGKNVIAIQGHNQNLYSPDFSLVPTLKGS